MTMRVWAFLAATLASSAATADTLTDDFFDLVENTCLPAIEDAEVPGLSGLTPHDRDNPDHNVLGPTLWPGFVTDDPRLLVAYGERNGWRGCEVSFSVGMPSGEGAMITDALETWIENHIVLTPYILVSDCGMLGFKYLVSAGSADQNPRGYFVRIVAQALVDLDDDALYGEPRFIVAETPDPSAEECIGEGSEPG